jgi:hypothetical protein|tara:strand:+ start:156 stop:575 length:420 start_codon:yes stop_codon:yes gene_type:complete
MDEEEFVAQILKDRVENKLSSKKEIQILNDNILVEIYSNYMKYNKNEENLVKSRARLQDYYFSNNNFSKGDYVTYINGKYFYDLRIHKGGFVREINDEMLRLVNGNSIWSININKVRIFTKLNKEQKLKLIIIDTLEEE